MTVSVLPRVVLCALEHQGIPEVYGIYLCGGISLDYEPSPVVSFVR